MSVAAHWFAFYPVWTWSFQGFLQTEATQGWSLKTLIDRKIKVTRYWNWKSFLLLSSERQELIYPSVWGQAFPPPPGSLDLIVCLVQVLDFHFCPPESHSGTDMTYDTVIFWSYHSLHIIWILNAKCHKKFSSSRITISVLRLKKILWWKKYSNILLQ